jgi:ribonucleoside-diphosphate reductase alpha chain
MLDGKKFNWERYSELIGLATRFIDHTIDVNNFPLDKIKETTLKTRPIGLGNMGLAHVLFKKEIPYNSEKAFKFTEEVNRYETLRSMQESVEMAKEVVNKWKVNNYPVEIAMDDPRGTKEPKGAYPAFDYDLFMKANARFFTKNCREIDVKKLADDIKKYGIRNSSFTSIAPTGSISFIADVSSGMEPVFGLAYYRKIEQITKEKEYDSVFMSDPIFEEYLNKNFDEKTRLKILAEVADNNGSCQTCNDIPEDMRKVFVTATDLTPKEHLYILEAVANNVSLSVSKTINLPSDIDKKEISDVFLDAHDKGIIGVTVYREGSRQGILVHNDTQINSASITSIIERNAPKRPKDLPCEIHRVMYQGKMWIVFVGMYEDKPFEVFAGAIEDVNIPKAITNGHIVKQKSQHYSFLYDDEVIVNNIGKTFANKEHDAFARVISQELRHFIPLKFIVDVLNKSEGGITHFSKVIARTLKKYIPDGEDAGKCQQCGSKLVYFEGCMKCSNLECGFSKCG